MPSRSDLAKIHIAKKALKLSDKVYRHVLFEITGEETARNLSVRQIAKTLNHFKNLGWKPVRREISERPRAAGKRFDELGKRPGMATPAQLRKIEVLWMTGIGIRAKTVFAMRNFLKNRFGVSDPRFIKSGHVTPILAAIKRMSRNHE